MDNNNKQRGSTWLIAAMMVICFLAAGFLGYKFFGELKTRDDAHSANDSVQQIAVQQAVEQTPTPTPVEGAPTATPEPPQEVELEEEVIDDDSELEYFLRADEEGLLDDVPTPPSYPQMMPQGQSAPTLQPAQPTQALMPPQATPQQAMLVETDGETNPVHTALPYQTEQNPLPTEEVKATAAPGVEVTQGTVQTTASPEASVAPAAITDTATMLPADASNQPTQAPTQAPTPMPTITPAPTPVVGTSVESDIRYQVDFFALQEVNKEVRGWIMQEGTEINYPIAQHSDNEYYITHLFDGRLNKAGSIYMDCGNSPSFTDGVTYLYGHNRKDDTMFASIPKYQDMAYWRAHPTMLLMTPYEDYQIEIFACVRRSIREDELWRVRGYTSRAEFNEAVDTIIKESFIKTGIRPQWGDQMIALVTCTNEVSSERYIVYGRLRPIVYTSENTMSIEKEELDSRQGTSRVIDVPGRGPTQYYAQNDPVWANMIYASKNSQNRGTMASSGCGPTSMAMIIANLSFPEYYWWINYYSGLETGLRFCSHSVNQLFCNHSHSQYRLSTEEEFLRYMPVAVASYATGNNRRKVVARNVTGGTGSVLFGLLAKDYGFEMKTGKSRDELL
ncbi:MAG: sortase [Clostridia bacterium]|nr:sortase [Clostridia bacterium]